jgi:hypothetical protein
MPELTAEQARAGIAARAAAGRPDRYRSLVLTAERDAVRDDGEA